MGKLGPVICVAIGLATIVGCYFGSQYAEKVFQMNKGLALLGKFACTDLEDMSDLSNVVSGNCYGMRADFALAPHFAPNILNEQIGGDCMMVTQTVEMLREVKVQRCSRSLGGDVVETVDIDDDDDSDFAKKTRTGRSGHNCHDEWVQRWKTYENSDDRTGEAWDFPSTNASTHGMQTFTNPNIHLKGATGNQVRVGAVAAGLSALRVRREADDHKIEIWDFQDGRDIYNLCISAEAADTVWPNDNQGLTNAEFTGSANYASTAYYPNCNNAQLGAYKVHATCWGQSRNNVRVIAALHLDDASGEYIVKPWRDSGYQHDLAALYAWNDDGSLTVAQTLDKYITEIAALAKGSRTVFNVLIVIGLIVLGIGGKQMMDGGSSSSSDSSF